MGKPPFASGACCPPNVSGITYLKVGPQKRTVGMQKLDEIFQELVNSNQIPEEVTDDQLVGMARKSNYIARNPSTESNYAIALRRAYADYYKRQEERSEREI